MKKGETMSDELKKKISESNKHKHNMTPEGRKKISQTIKNRSCGNGRAGKICITNGISCKYIFPKDIDSYIKDGWYKGTLKKPMSKELRNKISERTIEAMKKPEIRQKLSNAAKRNANKERFLKVRRKNTITMTPHEKYVSDFMFNLGFEYEPRIFIKEYKELNPNLRLPNYYKPDFGNSKLRIAIELDGKSHKSYGDSFEIDMKKERALSFYGYKTFRFKNKEIYEDKFKITVLDIVTKRKEVVESEL